jgi:hypothetical protein
MKTHHSIGTFGLFLLSFVLLAPGVVVAQTGEPGYQGMVTSTGDSVSHQPTTIVSPRRKMTLAPYRAKKAEALPSTTTLTSTNKAITASRASSALLDRLNANRFVALDSGIKVCTTSSGCKGITPFRAGADQEGQTLVTVPEGKLLVIELVTGVGESFGNNSEFAIELVISNLAEHIIIAPSHTTFDGLGVRAFYTQSVRFYVLPGEVVKVFQFGTAFRLTVSGYFVDL